MQNSESAPSALLSDALVVSLELEDDEASSSPDPPQAASRTAAAVTARPFRHAVRVLRMLARLAAGEVGSQAPG
jgi:hypothetical protein